MATRKFQLTARARIILFAVCAVLLIVIYFFPAWFRGLECSMPFSVCYHSWLELPLLLSLLFLGLVMSFIIFIAQFKRVKISKIGGFIYFIISVLAAALYFIYHLNYKDTPQVQVFRSAETVKPFHVQLGELFFCGMLLTNFMLLFLKPLNLWIRIAAFAIAAGSALLITRS
jgi:hypothetical protein